MNPPVSESSWRSSCKWCGINASEICFENARLCRICNEKALIAAQNPQLCKECSGLAINEAVSLELLSEDGYSHHNRQGLEMASSSGCGLCRMMLLQDPNPDERRLMQSLSLFAETGASVDGSWRNIKSLYFSSFPDMFRLKMAVSTASGIRTSPYILFVALTSLQMTQRQCS